MTIFNKLIVLYNLSDRTLDGELPNYPHFSSYCIGLILYSIGGCVFALWVWKGNEQEYFLRKNELTRSEVRNRVTP